jgi:nickel-dependent lactate racemase
MTIEMPYGAETLRAEIPWGRVLGTLDIAPAEAVADVAAGTRAALARPIGACAPLREIVKSGERVVIVVSDSFRTTRMEQVLPTLLETLAECGARDEDITFLFSTGTHRGPTPEEAEKILGAAVYARFRDRAITHDAADTANLVDLGTTSRGTPVKINRLAVECDRLIVTGTVVLHYFGGFGGGRKSIVPGIAGVDTIAANHSKNLHATENALDPAVRIGVMDGNPVAEDMLEAARLVKTDFMINTVLNRDNAIAGIFAGELGAAHRAAAAFAHGLYCVPCPEQADIVVASAGSAKNYLQSHKALFNAHQALKPGGRIVFVARAPEGLGGNKLAKWLELGSRAAIIEGLRRNAEINGQTALSTIEKAAISDFVTELSDEDTATLGARKAAGLADALEHARACLPGTQQANPSIWLMPTASYAVPVSRDKEP